MPTDAVISVDIGTSSSKGVLVDLTGSVLGSEVREHAVARPAPGHVEMDAVVWWELISITTALTTGVDARVVAVGVSGMGPCVLLTDEADRPLRPAILCGVDTRPIAQIERLNRELGTNAILRRCGTTKSQRSSLKLVGCTCRVRGLCGI